MSIIPYACPSCGELYANTHHPDCAYRVPEVPQTWGTATAVLPPIYPVTELTNEDEARSDGYSQGYRAALRDVLEYIREYGKQGLAGWVDQTLKNLP